ncbi:MAG: serine/threonine protein kinase [Clostridiaceae bacterium]|jgi:hypothetical protein|nr:serine/threonine protein kinase [Clostridiaceae bacterium]
MKKVPNKVLKFTLLFILLAAALIITGYITDFKYSYSGYKSHNEGIKAAALEKTKPLPPPSELTVKAVNNYEADLSWKEVKDADSYAVYRSEISNDNYVYAGNTAKPNFKDSGLTPGDAYYYKVSTVKNNKKGDKSKEYSVTLQPISQIGTSSANAANGGLFAKEGDWIYFSNSSDNNSLYKMKTDGSGIKKISNLQCKNINAINGWVYFTSPGKDGSNIYKIRDNGTGLKQLSSDIRGDSSLYVVGQWMYYSGENFKLSKMRIDGGKSIELNNTQGTSIIVDGDWIYYSMLGHDMNKIKTDGTAMSKLDHGMPGFINVENGWIYYTNGSDNDIIYKVKTDGTGFQLIGYEPVTMGMAVQNGWVYYINMRDNRNIYKTKTDGSERKKLTSDGGIDNISIIDNYIYYLKSDSQNTQFKIKIDGSSQGPEKVIQ